MTHKLECYPDKALAIGVPCSHSTTVRWTKPYPTALWLCVLLLLRTLSCRLALVEAAMEELTEAHADGCLEVQRMLQLHNDYLANPDAPDTCYLCREEGSYFSQAYNAHK